MKVTLFLMVFLLAACNGGNGSSLSDDKAIPMCPEQAIHCASRAATWTINSTPINFPENFLIKLNDIEAIDTCKYPQAKKISKFEGRILVEFTFGQFPENSPLKVEIMDLGENCDNDAIFHSEDSTLYGVIRMRTNDEEETTSVSAKLNN